ncbi:hypothetical protein OG884_22690 [Streptosporangium sp. NBC_01755]|uniref:hypothetical protein n=1 Tax=unclassified Streptosporangium TaxID=2632669 RepID=UPI002DD7DDBF|nr:MULTISPECIES: hypothetical protein [unclassified Streptosporangium]WSA24227.1 hypothetical protein OIE13_25225 [Streptosporangium sp. NBC_01810]WSC97697.1 hypothetical protein OG884_22690 [Streptosporangium sp. NBC_01755]
MIAKSQSPRRTNFQAQQAGVGGVGQVGGDVQDRSGAVRVVGDRGLVREGIVPTLIGLILAATAVRG